MSEKSEFERILVPEDERSEFLSMMAGRQAMKFEMMVFHFMERLCSSYRGGHWQFYRFPGGGGYMAPNMGDELLHLEWSMNCFQGKASPDTTGIIVTLHGLSHCSFVEEEESERIICDNFNKLYRYVTEGDDGEGHKDALLILDAID